MDEKPDETFRPELETKELFLKFAFALAERGCTGDIVVTLSDADFRRVFWPKTPMTYRSPDEEVPPDRPRLTREEFEMSGVRFPGAIGEIIVRRAKT